MSALRENWRIAMLIVFLLVSGIFLFAPGIGASEGPTNLKYGLDLDGGTRVRAPLVGIHAEDVSIGNNNPTEISSNLVDELDVDSVDVNVILRSETTADIEVYSQNVTQQQLQSAIESLGLSVDSDNLNGGVTAQTRQRVINTLSQKINRGGLTGGTVTQVSGGGQPFIVVEVPGENESSVKEVVSQRGTVEIVAEVKDENGTLVANETVVTGDELSVGQIIQEGNVWWVQITVDDEAAEGFSQRLQDLGFTRGDGLRNCDRRGGGANKPGSYCLLSVLNGNVIHSNGMGNLANSLNSGDFVNDPGFRLGTPNQSTAQDVRLNLQVGSLPTNLDVEGQGTSSYLAPSLAQEFKPFALITGLVAWIGVSVMVFIRYKSVRVAIPMLFTAIAEVFILLGFSAIVGLALDLSHIAGFIAVIGTGVDDLVIIADEILQQGKVTTGRVFQSRFRKAFWVIGAAAATTIIAMSPLAVLSLGDLQGFAIVTIAGVLIGVLVTRPAYGDVLRNLVLDEEQS